MIYGKEIDQTVALIYYNYLLGELEGIAYNKWTTSFGEPVFYVDISVCGCNIILEIIHTQEGSMIRVIEIEKGNPETFRPYDIDKSEKISFIEKTNGSFVVIYAHMKTDEFESLIKTYKRKRKIKNIQL